MGSIVSRTLSIAKEHELLQKLESAGLNEQDAQRVIESRGNQLGKDIVALIRAGRTTTTSSVTDISRRQTLLETLMKMRERVSGELEGVYDRVIDTMKNEIQALTDPVYPVTVNRDKKLKQMIEAGQYDWVHSDITDKHFPVEGSGTEQVEVILRHYDKIMSKDAVLADLDKDGLRPIRIEELLALGADPKTRDLQREFPIIALGSVWQSLDGHRNCPYLPWDGSERDLSLGWVGLDWNGYCRFAAVRK